MSSLTYNSHAMIYKHILSSKQLQYINKNKLYHNHMKVYTITITNKQDNTSIIKRYCCASKKIAQQHVAKAFGVACDKIMSYSNFCKHIKRLDALYMHKHSITFFAKHSNISVVIRALYDNECIEETLVDGAPTHTDAYIEVDLTSKL